MPAESRWGAKGLGGVGDGVGGGGGDGYALVEVGLDDGVEAVGGLVVEAEVLVDGVPEDEGGDALDIEAGVVGFEEEFGVGAGGSGAEAVEEWFDVGEGLFFVFAAHQVPAFGGLGAGVGDENCVDGGHVGGVFFGVGGRAYESLLFAAEEDEAEGSAGRAIEGLDGSGGFEDGGDAGAVVLRAGGRVPGVEMGSDDDDGVRLFAAWDLGDYVADFGGRADAVFEGEVDGDRAFVQHALDERGVFEADLGYWEVGEAAADGEAVCVLASVGVAGEEDGLGLEGVKEGEGFDELADGGMFAEAGVIDEDDLAGQGVFCGFQLFEGKQCGQIDDFTKDSVFRGGRAPAGGVDVEGLDAWLDDLACGGNVRLPECGHGEGLGVDVGEADGAELFLGPVGGLDVVGGTGEAGADAVGKLAVVFIGVAIDHDVAD